jgi:16S rRNA (guanine527-N7)-methyltransferase
MQQILTDGFEALGLPLTAEMSARFLEYYDRLTKKNAVMNLTAITGDTDTARLHFLDCAALCSLWDFSGASVLDVGTGAGFPGLPLKIIAPDIALTLLDSSGKKVAFLEETCAGLGFPDVRCVCARAEDIAPELGGSFDIAVSRAVARLSVLCELCLPFVHVGGAFIAMKGPDCAHELEEASKAISVLGGKKARLLKYAIPGTGIVHSAVVIEKSRRTPGGYPRPFARIKKAPL